MDIWPDRCTTCCCPKILLQILLNFGKPSTEQTSAKLLSAYALLVACRQLTCTAKADRATLLGVQPPLDHTSQAATPIAMYSTLQTGPKSLQRSIVSHLPADQDYLQHARQAALLAESGDVPVGWIPAWLLDRPLVPGENVFLAEEGNYHATQQGNSNKCHLYTPLGLAGSDK